MANIKLDTPAGKRYISRKRSTTDNPIQDLFAQINQRFIDLEESDPDKLNDIVWLKNNMPFYRRVVFRPFKIRNIWR